MCAAALVLLGAGLASADDAIYSAWVPKTAEARTLAAFEGSRVVHRALDSKGRVVLVFVAEDRALSAAEKRVRRGGVLPAEGDLSLYRARFKVRYGALPLPKGDGCREGLGGRLESLQDPECMDKLVREALVKATDEEARKAAAAQVEAILAAFRPAEGEEGPAPVVVSRRVRTYLVKTGVGEAQEAEVEVVFVAATLARPVEVAAQRPIEGQTLTTLAPVRR